MAALTTAEMTLIDTLFDMYSGSPLSFSNSTFEAFFANDVGIDIYSDRYAGRGESKGKRLRTFLEVASVASIAKALRALWEVRESERLGRGEPDTVPHSRARLNALLVRIGGKALPAGFEEPQASPVASTATAAKRPGESSLAAIETEFLALTAMNEQPHERGRAFERFLKRWFDVWDLDSHAAFSTKSEQIDGSFQHDNATYLVEAKWHTKPTNGAMLHGFQGKLLERPDWTRGLYVSYGGFSNESFDAFTARRLIMMDGTDIYHTLHRRLDLGVVIGKKVRHHSEHRKPFARVTDLFPA